jgi:hypothetical protein
MIKKIGELLFAVICNSQTANFWRWYDQKSWRTTFAVIIRKHPILAVIIRTIFRCYNPQTPDFGGWELSNFFAAIIRKHPIFAIG